ncbi:MAG: PilZ domain-containing protein [Candidatus Korobacteraceae bacterium]
MSCGQKPDFRNAIRFPLHLPVSLRSEAGEYLAETRDISAGGILFLTHSEIGVGEVVQFTIRMPGETLGAAEDVLVQCSGRVVRSVQEGSGHIVAVAIDEYRFEQQ